MRTDLLGKVHNTKLKKSDVLITLFEAIDNSIDSILENSIKSIAEGEILITICRSQSVLENEQETITEGQITGFKIRDNGIGFTSKNYESFLTADSIYKLNYGGKGNGRFQWLKAFDNVIVSSCYNNGSSYYREFSFNLGNQDGVEEIESKEMDISRSWSEIYLKDIKNEYSQYLPTNPQTISKKIAYHFLKKFILGNMPQVIIIDGDIELDVNNDYQEIVNNEFKTNKITIKEKDFSVTQGLIKYKTGMKHELLLCAKDRPVDSLSLTPTTIPNLPKTITQIVDDEEQKCVYLGFVSSSFLDMNVSRDRDGFSNIEKKGEIENLLESEIYWEDITTEIYTQTSDYLKPHLEWVKEEKNKKIAAYVKSTSPQYSYILKHHSDLVDEIAPDIPERELETELNRIAFTLRTEFKKNVERTIQELHTSTPVTDQEIEDTKEKILEYLEKGNDIGKADLALYIIQRKIILDMLDTVVKAKATGKFATEEYFHKFIFPIKNSSDDITYEQHNLWVIDEKLVV